MPIKLYDYQEEVVNDCIDYFRSKEGRQPAVVNVSVSGGKTAIAAFLARHVAGKGGNVMVLARQGELIEQNAEFAERIGVEVSIYSASLNLKQMLHSVIMGTEGTVARALDAEYKSWKPDLVLIDECHMVDFEEEGSMFMRIISHFYKLNPKMRMLGLTGSPYRGTESILGDFWHKLIGNISTEFLMEQGFIVEPVFGWPEHEEDSFCMSEIQTKYGSWEFSEDQMDAMRAQDDPDKTMRVTLEVVHRTADDLGVLIFAQTKKHCAEIAQWLPDGSWAIITDDTPAKERAESIRKAKTGSIKYTLNVQVLTTGVNVPYWQTVVYMRPVGSLVLLIQSLGRVLRLLLDGDISIGDLTPDERKELIAASLKPWARVLDYCGVFERLGHLYDNPLLEAAQLEKSKREGSIIFCPKCNAENSDKARRCVGNSGGERCDHFFVSVDCPACGTKNDITARQCRKCDHTLIDPNKAMTGKAYSEDDMTPVQAMTLSVAKGGQVLVSYQIEGDDWPYEVYAPAGSNIARLLWWNRFLVPHCPQSWQSKMYMMKNAPAIVKMQAVFDAPIAIAYRKNEKGKWVIGRKRFRTGRTTNGSGKNVDN